MNTEIILIIPFSKFFKYFSLNSLILFPLCILDLAVDEHVLRMLTYNIHIVDVCLLNRSIFDLDAPSDKSKFYATSIAAITIFSNFLL